MPPSSFYTHPQHRTRHQSPDSLGQPALMRPARALASTLPRTLTGVDTLRLVVPFEVEGETNLRVIYDSRRPERNRPLWVNAQGEATWGVMALWGNECLQLRISPNPRGRGAQCWLTFSAPKLLYGTNARTCNAAGLKRALQAVEKLALDLGVWFDWRDAVVSRLDICRNVVVPRPVAHYLPLLRHFDIKYGRYVLNYPTGITRGNKSSQLCVYDKRAEIHARALASPSKAHKSSDVASEEAALPLGNVMRFEWRLRNARAVRNKLDIHTAEELVWYFRELKPWLDTQLADNLFREEVRPIPMETVPVSWRTPLALPCIKAKEVEAIACARGYDAWMEDAKDDGEFLGLLKTVCSSPSERAALTKLQAKLRGVRLSMLSPHGVSLALLYKELKETALMRHT